MKVGIVGGTGNISTSVVRLLQERGHDVTCITRGASGSLPDGIRHLSGDRHDLDWFVPAVQRERFEAAIDFIGFSTIGQTYFLVNPRAMQWSDIHGVAMDVLGREVEQVGVSADALFELDPKLFMMVPGVFAKNLLYSCAKLQRDVPEFRPSVSLHDGLADAFEHLEANGLVEDVPVGDWEDRIIEIQRDARSRILEG